jgi:hypothetical protein
MKKEIVKAALSTVYPENTLERLEKVIFATVNPEYAVALLLDFNQKERNSSELFKAKTCEKNVKEDSLRENLWTDTISGKELLPKRLDCWVPKEVENPTLADVVCAYGKSSIEGIKSDSEVESKEGLKNVYVNTGELKEESFEISIHNW